jgi:hypothetical protein
MASQQARTQPQTEMYVSIYEQKEWGERNEGRFKTVSDYSCLMLKGENGIDLH